MARLFYFPQTDEVPTPPPPFNVDDDSGDWWAGTQWCSAATAFAATLAGVALSASLAWGLQQQTDDIIPKVEEEYWLVATPPPTSTRFLYLPDPEEIPAGVLRQLDELYWQVYTPPEPPKQPLYLPDPEEIPAGQLYGVPEEDAWLSPTPASRLWTTPWTADDEIVPQPVTFGIDEDYWIQLPYQPALWVTQWGTADDEIVPQRPFEEDAWVPLPLASVSRWNTAWTADEEIVPQPAVVTPEEEYWFQLTRSQDQWFAWTPPVDTDTSPHPPVEEEYWLSLPYQPAPWVAWWGSADDEITSRPVEEYWFQPGQWRTDAVVWIPVSDEEIVQQPIAFVPDDDAWVPSRVSWQTPTNIPDPWFDDQPWVPFVAPPDVTLHLLPLMGHGL